MDFRVQYLLSQWAQRVCFLKFLRHQGMLLPEQLPVVTKAIIIISRILYALPAWGRFLSVELICKINAFSNVLIVLVICNVILIFLICCIILIMTCFTRYTLLVTACTIVYLLLVPLVTYVVVDTISSCQSAIVNWVKIHLLPGLSIVTFRLPHSLGNAAAFYCVNWSIFTTLQIIPIPFYFKLILLTMRLTSLNKDYLLTYLLTYVLYNQKRRHNIACGLPRTWAEPCLRFLFHMQFSALLLSIVMLRYNEISFRYRYSIYRIYLLRPVRIAKYCN